MTVKSPFEDTKPHVESIKQQNTSFKGDIIRLVAGSGFAQVIAIAALPIITRFYTPAYFGIAAIFASICGMLGVLACMRYELSIVLPNDDREAANLLALSLLFSFLMGLVLAVLVFTIGPELLSLINMSELTPYMWLFPIVVMIQGIYAALNYWTTRTKHFMNISVSRVSSQLVSTSITIGTGISGYASGGAMIIASASGQSVASVMLIGQVWRDNGRFLIQNIRWNEMIAGLKRYKKFPLYSSWSAFLNTASWHLPVVLLGVFFSSTVVGFYALGLRIIQTPMSLISKSVSQVFLQRASVEKVDGDLGSLVEELFRKLLTIALLPCLILTFVGEDLFSVFFGDSWKNAGVFTQLLAPWACVWFISSPLSSIFSVLEKQEKEPMIHTIIFLTRIVAICIGGYMENEKLAVLFFSIAGIFSYGYLVKMIFGFCNLKTKSVLRNNIKLIFIAIIFVLPLAILKISSVASVYLVFVSLITILLYFLYYKGELLAFTSRSAKNL